MDAMMNTIAPNISEIKLVGGTNPAQFPKISLETTYNMYSSYGALITYPGYARVRQLGLLTNSRGIYESQIFNHMIVVVDERVRIISTALGIATIGTLDTNAGDVFFAENANSEIAISDNQNYYVYNYNTGAFAKHDIGFHPGQLGDQNGYIFAVQRGTSIVRYSNVNDALTWDVRNASSFGNEVSQGVKNLGNLVFMFGTQTTRILRNLGQAINPYRQDPSTNILYGTLNPNSIASGFNMICWVGAGKDLNTSILVSTGGIAQKISTPGIDTILQKLTNPKNCYAFIFQQDGHIFYQVTFLADNITLVYDFTSQEFLNSSDQNMNHHIAQNCVRFNNSYYFISFADEYLYEMGSKYENFDGEVIPQIRILPPIRRKDYQQFIIKKLEMNLQQGQSESPQYVDLSISRNGGATFGNVVRNTLTPLADRKMTTQWFQLGLSNDITLQFRFVGLSRFVVLSAYIQER